MPDIFIDKKSLEEIRSIIKRLYPKATVWAYGSRIGCRKDSHDGSDLDLTVVDFGQKEYDIAILKEAFRESSIPFLIDVSDFRILPLNFQKEIEKKYFIVYFPKENL